MGNDSFEDRETIKKLTNDDFDFLVKKMGVNSQFWSTKQCIVQIKKQLQPLEQMISNDKYICVDNV